MFIYSRYQTLIVDLSIVLNDIVLNAFLVQAISTYAPNLTNAQSKENPFQKKACWNADKTITCRFHTPEMTSFLLLNLTSSSNMFYDMRAIIPVSILHAMQQYSVCMTEVDISVIMEWTSCHIQ